MLSFLGPQGPPGSQQQTPRLPPAPQPQPGGLAPGAMAQGGMAPGGLAPGAMAPGGLAPGGMAPGQPGQALPADFVCPLRPNHGVEGRPILLRANHFQVRMPQGVIHHYDISISPDKCPRRVNR